MVYLSVSCSKSEQTDFLTNMFISQSLHCIVVTKPGVVGSIPGLSSLLDETLSQDKLLTRTDSDEAGDYAVPNVLSP